MTSSNKLLWGAILLGFAVGGATALWPARALPETTSISIPIESVADYIHAVIEADRDVYTRHVVERLQTRGVVDASENWEQRNTLPLPAQFLLESGRQMGKKGLGLQYRLISLWPINKRNLAANAFESIGLGAVLTQPNRPYTGITRVGDTRVFEAVYADLAITQSCVGCHNAHPDSPKHDFKMNDVMGAIVISIQLAQ
ncbi:MAG: Tll0287-like domain-containing protein [Nitrospiraceae bacterium]